MKWEKKQDKKTRKKKPVVFDVILSVGVRKAAVLIMISEVEVFLAPARGFPSAVSTHQPADSLAVETHTQTHISFVIPDTVYNNCHWK